MKTLLSIVFASLLIMNVFAEPPEKYSRIKILVPDREFLNKVWESGIDFEGTSGKPGGWMEFVAGKREMELLSSNGVTYEVVIDDLAAYESSFLTQGPVDALGFGYGSMGGYYTYVEVGAQLDSMRTLYPSLITAKTSIGTGHEGREIWIAKISDSPETNEPQEPEILYTALHHAREPEGMMTVMYYMWWLLENYGTNEEATYLVNNRQMYFIPVVNPDGYVHNQTTNPNGGGYWRENRRPNGGSCYGVDLNRNYGPYAMWNSSNGGSSVSTTCGQGTYRGPSPFSEPETAAIDTLMREHNFKTAFNYHTYGNYLIYPYGYLSRENGDSLIYREWTYEMQFDNHYTNGTDQQTVNYSTRGNSDDYMYGDVSSGKAVTYTMTPEVGTTGFWPSTGEIFPLAQQNLKQNKVLAYVGGSYPVVTGYTIEDSTGDSFLERGESFSFILDIKNRGLGDASSVQVDVVSSNPSVQLSNVPMVLPSIASQTTSQAVLTGSTSSTAITGVPFELYVMLSDPDGFVKRDTIKLFLGTPSTLLTDSATDGTGNWTTGSGWGATPNYHTPPYAFTDSPSGNYGNNADNSLTLINPISLAGYQYAQLRFWTKWALEPTWDFATVEISTNNGSTWTTQRTKLSHSGSARSNSKQPSGTWGYESYTPGLTWVEQNVDVSGYSGSQIKLRFRLAADGGEVRDGLYVDDIRLYGWNPNYDTTAASATTLEYPSDGSFSVPRRPTLRWHSSPGALWYRLQVASDSLFASIVYDDSTLTDTLRLINPLSYDAKYFWRVNARNNVGASPFTEPWAFTTIIAPPAAPSLAFPANNQTHLPLSFLLEWYPSSGAVNYILHVSDDSLFGSYIVDDSTLVDTAYSLSGLSLHTKYYWRVKGVNAGGTSIFSEERNFTTVGTAPSVPTLATPEDGAQYQPSTITLYWNETAGVVNYHLQVASDSEFSVIAFEDSTLADVFANVSGLGNEALYYWRVRASNDFGSSDWSAAWRFTTGTYTLSVLMNNRWNLVSVPVLVQNFARNVVFNSAISDAFAYNGTYVQMDTLESGSGYWLKFGSQQNVTMVGQLLPSQNIPVNDGWNIIGSLTYPIDATSITSNPGGMMTSEFYGFDEGYETSNSIIPGKGYWVKVNGSGELVLSSVVSHSSLENRITIVPTSELPPPSPEGNGNLLETSDLKPETFGLSQNYPNPFNPTTVIRYQLSVDSWVTLKVYNLLGDEVATLVNQFQVAGFKSQEWNLIGLPSGVYVYRINVESVDESGVSHLFGDVKKMILTK